MKILVFISLLFFAVPALAQLPILGAWKSQEGGVIVVTPNQMIWKGSRPGETTCQGPIGIIGDKLIPYPDRQRSIFFDFKMLGKNMMVLNPGGLNSVYSRVFLPKTEVERLSRSPLCGEGE